MTANLIMTIRVRPDGLPIVLSGRNAWALSCLLRAGSRGFTSLGEPAPRLAAYVHVLRSRHGIEIETLREKHGGDFPGSHARYVLLSSVEILPTELSGEELAA